MSMGGDDAPHPSTTGSKAMRMSRASRELASHDLDNYVRQRAVAETVLYMVCIPIRLAQGGWQILDMFVWSEYPAPVLGWR